MTDHEPRRLDMEEAMSAKMPMEPPADVPEIQRGNWLALDGKDPVAQHLAASLWDRLQPPESWEVSRLSNTAYIYREASTRWSVVAKFYSVKSSSAAEEYATREFDRIRQVQQASLSEGTARAVEPLALWRGVLFLEYVPGLTLENIIAVRHSQPGRLNHALRLAARFLAQLHVTTARKGVQQGFSDSVEYAHDVVDQLAKYGVLQHYPITQEGLRRSIDRWARNPEMSNFQPSLTHGDATTTNFVFPQAQGVVVIDWERLYARDPAFDLGRLMAEITHSINQHGGSVAEAEAFVQHVAGAYSRALPGMWDAKELVNRARFYRASSTLRIARNGWVSRLDRTALVAQAMALLAQ